MVRMIHVDTLTVCIPYACLLCLCRLRSLCETLPETEQRSFSQSIHRSQLDRRVRILQHEELEGVVLETLREWGLASLSLELQKLLSAFHLLLLLKYQ